MKLLDVSTPGIWKKRVLNVPSSGWMAVVRWITSGGLLHEGGQAKPERQEIRDDLIVILMSNAAVSGAGRRLRNALPPCGQVTWHFLYGGLCSACTEHLSYSAKQSNRRSLPPSPAVHGAMELAYGHENEPSLP